MRFDFQSRVSLVSGTNLVLACFQAQLKELSFPFSMVALPAKSHFEPSGLRNT